MRATLECLLATTLGDLEALGTGQLLRDASCGRLGDLTETEWSEILAARFPDVVYPALRHNVKRALSGSEGDVLKLLRFAAEHVSGDSQAALGGSRFPVGLFAQAAESTARGPLGFDVADGHLHSGASMPLRMFLRGLATRKSAIKQTDETPALTVVTSTGRSWDLVLLLAAARWALRLLWYVRYGGRLDDGRSSDQWGLRPDRIAAVRDGTFWRDVREALTDGEVAKGAFAQLNQVFFDKGICRPVDEIFWNWHGAQPAGEFSDTFLVDLARVLAVIASVVTSRPGEGLSRFVDRFKLMGQARGAALDDHSFRQFKDELMLSTVKAIVPTTEVAGAEFRKTVATSDPTSFREEVRAALATHHTAFARLAQEYGTSLTMPVGFRRHASPTLNPSAAGIAELTHVLAGCQALVQIHGDERGAELIDAIWSIDVADEEVGSSNWPFQIGAEILADASVPLRFTIHAGESFVSPLNGVRRVGELFLGAIPPDRIGHALALSPTATAAVLKRGYLPIVRAEAISDVAWLCHIGVQSGPAHDLLQQLVQPAYPNPSISPADWVEGFVRLHRLADVERLLVADLGGPRSVARKEELHARARTGSAVDRAIAALAWSAPPEIAGCEMASELTGSLREDYISLSQEAATEAREHVIDLVREHRATIEACPTSNVKLAGLPGYEDHPLWDWVGQMDVTVSSDDPLLFGATVLDEYRALLATGRDPHAVRKVADVAVQKCSGGPGKRLSGWDIYQRVADFAGSRI